MIKQRFLYVAGLVLLSTLFSCQSSHLDQSAAQRAVQRAFDSDLRSQIRLPANSRATILGITENEVEQTAVANMALANVSVADATGAPPCTFENGKATFNHYSDGRWVLTSIMLVSRNMFCSGGPLALNIPTS